MVLKLNLTKRILMMLFVLLLAFTLVYSFPTQEVHAFLPALLLAPAAIEALGGIMISLGIMYAGQQAIDKSVKYWFSDSNSSTRQAIIDCANNARQGVMTVSDTVFNSCKDFINSKFQAENTSTNFRDSTWEGYPYALNVDANPYINVGSVFQYAGDTYSMGITTVGTPDICYIFKNGVKVDTSFSVYAPEINSGFFFLQLSTGTNILSLSYRYYTGASTQSNKTVVASLATGVPVPYEEAIPYTSTGIANTVDADWKVEGQPRTVAVPTGDVSTLTRDSVINPAVPTTGGEITGEVTTTQSDTDKSWWSALVDALLTALLTPINLIKDAIDAIGELITTTGEVIANIYTAVAALAASIVTPIVAAIQSITSILELDGGNLGPKMDGYSLPDLFIVIWAILLACIRLVIRASAYLVTLVAIPPDSSMIPTDMLSGFTFIKGQQIAFLGGLSLWDCITSVFMLILSLSVVKKVRNTHN